MAITRKQIARDFGIDDDLVNLVIAYGWIRSSTFPTTPKRRLDKAADAFQRVWDELYPHAYTVSRYKLNRVHREALRRGLYEPQEKSKEQYPWQPRNSFRNRTSRSLPRSR